MFYFSSLWIEENSTVQAIHFLWSLYLNLDNRQDLISFPASCCLMLILHQKLCKVWLVVGYTIYWSTCKKITAMVSGIT
jgi:hypothetical protein